MMGILKDIALRKPLSGGLQGLAPAADEKALLRVQGRLFMHKRLPKDVGAPPILPANSVVAKHIMQTVHSRDLDHAGRKKTLVP